MLVVAGEIEIDPAHRDAAVEAAREMMEATRREEGCRRYVFSTDFDDPGLFHLFEEWDSEAAIESHMATPHMAEFRKKVAHFGVRRLTLRRYEVSSASPMS